MYQGIKQFLSDFWLPVLITILVLSIGVGGFLVYYNFVVRGRTGGQDVTTPVLVSTPADSGDLTAVDTGVEDDEDGEVTTFTIELSEGQPQPEEVEPVPVATGVPLSEAEIEAILLRLPELEFEAGDQVQFSLPDESLPPPRTGETIEQDFPPEGDYIVPETGEAGSLEVLRYSPEGEIPLAPFVNVTFNQPMVPLASLESLAAEDVPVRLKPDLPGTWKWIGTRTLTFEYESELIDRMPMATEFTVTVPAGTQSVIGGVLNEDISWTFSTPPPEMIDSYPGVAPQPRDPLLFVAFNQRIDPQAVLDTIEVTSEGKQYKLELVSEKEIEENSNLSWSIQKSPEGRWLAFKATELFPADAGVTVAIGPGTPSTEGSLVTTQAQVFSFSTYAPLKVEKYGCSWSHEECRPLSPFYIEFNNPLDVDAYVESMVTIEPALPGATVNIYGDTISIRGVTEGRTTYKVTIDGTLKDIFGQTLGKNEKLPFKVGKAKPALLGPDKNLITLDPASTTHSLSLYAINYNKLDVEIYAVEPSDWPAFKEYLLEFQRQDIRLTPPGTKVWDKPLRLDIPDDTLTEVKVDLGEVMEGDYGHFIVIVRPPSGLFQDEWERKWRTIQTWVQVTQIGLDAFVDHSELLTWVTALKDGAPLYGVTITADVPGINGKTGEDGIARFDLPDEGALYLVATKGDDVAFLPRSDYYWGDDTWYRQSAPDQLRWYVFDDRYMYKPGEEVHVKGWMRRIGGKQNGDVGLVNSAVTSVHYVVIGPQGNELARGDVKVDKLGGFDFVFTLPENANLGYAQLEMDAVGSLGGLDRTGYSHEFQIQEFRRPEFEVTARNETTGPYFTGDHAVVAVEAAYYAGGPLPNAETTWQVSFTPTNYTPPNWQDFIFGVWEPWWWYESPSGDTQYQTFNSVTDATGNHYLRLDFKGTASPRTQSVLAEATVMDVNRQAWAGMTSLMVHPADLYVGMRSERIFVERGDPLEVEFIVTDLDGNPVEDRPIKVTVARLEWKYSGGSWSQQEVDVQECLVGSTEEPVSCTFETLVGGRYQVTALVTDEMGRQNMSRMTRWVSGAQEPPSREVERETVNLILDKETYHLGDVAEVLVQSPFSPAEGMLTVSRSGILYTERFRIEDGTTTLKVPVEEAHIPNLYVQVDLVGATPRLDDVGEEVADVPPRPAYATGRLKLDIPPLERTLSLELIPQDTELEPGGETTLEVVLKDATGEAVADASLAVVVVDEAILALSSYTLADPVAVFYSERPQYLSSVYGRANVVLVDPMALADQAAMVEATATVEKQMLDMAEGEVMMEAPAAAPEGMAREEAGAAAATPIRVRSDFNPLATFAPNVRTDTNGKAKVTITLPDNLTRYRIMVVAVDNGGKQFGSAEANLTARLPLMVRPSASRFLNFGDRFELPVVLQNQTDKPMEVDVVIRAGNIKLTGEQGLRVKVPARDRIEVRFPATTESAGTARFQIAAASGDNVDAAQIELPVYTPTTAEAFAVYGVVDEGVIVQPIATLDDVFPQFGGLEITTSSTALQSLTDAVLYLVAYPFECSEQLASRILAVAALRDVLDAFEAEGLPSPEEMESAVVRDIERLGQLQNYDGGFPYWVRGKESIPYNTVHVAHALQRAKMMEFEVPENMQYRVIEYLRYIENYYPSWYSDRTRWTISAYALYVRDLMGDSDPNKAREMINNIGLEKLPLDATAWLWLALSDTTNSQTELDAIRRHINNRAVETAGAANFTTDYGDDAYLLLHSNRRTDALILDALIADTPQSDLIPKVVNGLMAHRTRGRWRSTQENVFILLALNRYFNTFEAQTPDFVARIWLGETYAGSSQFVGRTTERHQTDIPMSYLVDVPADVETQDLVLSKEGAGRLYYRLGLRYAPVDLDLDPLDMGFVIQRAYEAVDDPEDVYRDSDGVWHIRAGTRIRVRLTMVADNRRYHVALIDYLPAGLEIINPALAVSGSVPQDPDSTEYRYGWWWWWTWYEHQNMRDERAEAFTSLLWDGVYDYTYVTRATMPGTFVAPPARAEEMYSPEVFGRSGSDLVVVE